MSGRAAAASAVSLNPEQQRAVDAVSGPVLVVAGPGTGKTRVVTHRIANQVRAGVARPANVLAVTFTDKAASEMLARLRVLDVPAGGRGGARAATFHSAALRQVRWFWPRVTGEDPPEVLGSKVPIIGRMLRGHSARDRGGVDAVDLASEIEWVKAQGAALPGAPLERAADGGGAAAHGRHLAHLQLDGPAPHWELDRAAYRDALDEHEGPWPDDLEADAAADMFAAIFARYEEAKAHAGRIDFEDILAANTALLRRHEEVAATVRGQYTHLTVDEFQDVNRLQWDLLCAWLGDRDDVCVVGDGNQAIYGFSGASPVYLDAFRRRHSDATVVSLIRNYRSTQDILDLAAAALREPDDDGRLRAQRDVDGPKPLLVERSDEDAERDWVVARCRRLADAGMPWDEMAVLYRFNAQSEAWEEAFASAGIPYRIRGDEPFFMRRHVVRTLRVLRAAERGGEGEAREDDPLVVLDGAPPRRPPLGRLVRRLLKRRMSWSEEPPEGDRARERWADLSVLVDLADEFAEDLVEDPGEDEPDAVTLAAFLADLDRRAQAGREPDGGGVQLMTLHRAKGLEFDAVFVVSAEEGRVPSRYAVARDERAGREVARDPLRSGVAEERRLFYVGLTRARTHLHVTWVRRGSKRPSRFLDGLPGGPSRAKPVDRVRKSARGDAEEPLSADGERLFQMLREWRLERAMADGVPAYVVFPDSTLKGIARTLPTDRRELFGISGVGRTKLERYGEPVLELVAQHRAQQGATDGTRT